MFIIIALDEGTEVRIDKEYLSIETLEFLLLDAKRVLKKMKLNKEEEAEEEE